MRGIAVRRISAGLAIVGATLAVAACGSSSKSSTSRSASNGSSTSGSGTAAASTNTKICAPAKTIGVIDIDSSSPIEQAMDTAAEKAAADLGWKVDFTNAAASFTTAESAITADVQKKVNLIVMMSVSQGPLRVGLLSAKAAGVPVIGVGGGTTPTNLFAAYYGENEKELGTLLGTYIAKHIPNAKIGDLSTTFNYSGLARQAGLVQALKAAGGGATIVDNQDIPGTQGVTGTTKTLTDMLTAHSDINAVVATFDNFAIPAASVIRTQDSKAQLFSNFLDPTTTQLFNTHQIAGVVADNLPLTPIVAIDQYLTHLKTGAAYSPNAISQAGGLGYRVLTSAKSPWSLSTTLAPFLAKWHKEYSCS